MSNIQVFDNDELGSVRTVMIDNEPWFVGKDVADILGYANTPKAIRDHVDNEDKLTERIVLSGQNREVIFINESGLYCLIISSKLPSAKKFKHWVTSEVLPAIRKNGGYIAGQEKLSDEELMAKAILVAQKKIAERDTIIEKQAQKIEADKPKTVFADAVSGSETSILIGDLAKLIAQNGIKIGQKKLFKWLRENGYLMKVGASYNMPTQRYIENGYFEVKEGTVQSSNGSTIVTRTTLVTGKGQIYFVNKFLNMGDLEEVS